MSEASDTMRRAITDARALLATLVESDWTEIHVAAGDTEIFIAREGGRANPMREIPAAPEPVADAEGGTIVSAPHVATFVEALQVGSAVEQGRRVATLSLLDETFEIEAPVSGVIAAHHAGPGDLVEYGAAVVAIRAQAA